MQYSGMCSPYLWFVPQSHMWYVLHRESLSETKFAHFFFYILLSNSSFSLIIPFIFFKPEFHAISSFFFFIVSVHFLHFALN